MYYGTFLFFILIKIYFIFFINFIKRSYIKINLFIFINIYKFILWGLGIGDWGLGIGDWGLGPIPNPQSPFPNPQSPL